MDTRQISFIQSDSVRVQFLNNRLYIYPLNCELEDIKKELEFAKEQNFSFDFEITTYRRAANVVVEIKMKNVIDEDNKDIIRDFEQYFPHVVIEHVTLRRGEIPLESLRNVKMTRLTPYTIRVTSDEIPMDKLRVSYRNRGRTYIVDEVTKTKKRIVREFSKKLHYVVKKGSFHVSVEPDCDETLDSLLLRLLDEFKDIGLPLDKNNLNNANQPNDQLQFVGRTDIKVDITDTLQRLEWIFIDNRAVKLVSDRVSGETLHLILSQNLGKESTSRAIRKRLKPVAKKLEYENITENSVDVRIKRKYFGKIQVLLAQLLEGYLNDESPSNSHLNAGQPQSELIDDSNQTQLSESTPERIYPTPSVSISSDFSIEDELDIPEGLEFILDFTETPTHVTTNNALSAENTEIYNNNNNNVSFQNEPLVIDQSNSIHNTGALSSQPIHIFGPYYYASTVQQHGRDSVIALIWGDFPVDAGAILKFRIEEKNLENYLRVLPSIGNTCFFAFKNPQRTMKIIDQSLPYLFAILVLNDLEKINQFKAELISKQQQMAIQPIKSQEVAVVEMPNNQLVISINDSEVISRVKAEINRTIAETPYFNDVIVSIAYGNCILFDLKFPDQVARIADLFLPFFPGAEIKTFIGKFNDFPGVVFFSKDITSYMNDPNVIISWDGNCKMASLFENLIQHYHLQSYFAVTPIDEKSFILSFKNSTVTSQLIKIPLKDIFRIICAPDIPALDNIHLSIEGNRAAIAQRERQAFQRASENNNNNTQASSNQNNQRHLRVDTLFSGKKRQHESNSLMPPQFKKNSVPK